MKKEIDPMPKTRTPGIDYPDLRDFEPYRELAENLAKLEAKGLHRLSAAGGSRDFSPSR